MSWTKLRSWAGRHPALAMNLVVAIVFGPMPALSRFGRYLMGLNKWYNLDLAMLAVLVVAAGIMVCTALWVGCVLGRAGREPRRLLGGLAWVPVLVAAAFLVLRLFGRFVLPGWVPGLATASQWRDFAADTAACTGVIVALETAGWAIASRVTRRKRAGGRWETIVPPADEADAGRWRNEPGSTTMTWTRLRTWIGEHPAWAISLANGLWLGANVALFWVLAFAARRAPVRLTRLTWGSGLIVAELLAVAMLTTCLVGVLRGRAGLPVRRVGLALPWSLAACCAAMLALWGSLLALRRVNPHPVFNTPDHWRLFLIYLAVTSLVVLLGQGAGWVLAAVLTRSRIRRGEWEVTRPVGPARPEGPE